MHQICDFKGENWRAGLRRLKFLSLIDQIICKNNYQNTVFLSEALHGEIIIWNNQIFEEGYLSNPKYLGPTVLINIQLVPKSFSKYYWILLWLWLFMTQVVKYTTKVKVIKYFLQIFDIWNNGAGKKWGVRYTFWYIVLLTLCNGDRRIVQCLQYIHICWKNFSWNLKTNRHGILDSIASPSYCLFVSMNCPLSAVRPEICFTTSFRLWDHWWVC